MTKNSDDPKLRQRAEELLRKTRSDIASMPPQDVANLFYEFQVHQIELKMQNEELQRMERELQQSRDHFQALYELAPIAYLALDEHAIITESNQQACELFGVVRGRLVGTRFALLVALADRVGFSSQYRELLSDSQPLTWEFRICGAAGERIVRCKATGSRDENGRMGVRLVLSDLTEQRLAEARLNAEVAKREVTEKKLLKERDFAEGLISAVPGLLMELDRFGKIVRCNSLFQQIVGYSSDEVRGRDPIELLLPKTAQEATRARFTPVLRGQAGSGEIIPIITRSGQECIVTWRYAPLTDDDGKIVGLLVIGLDITERTQLESSLRQSQKMEAIGRLASGIAHDFNNLLMGLTGLAEIAASKLPAQSPARPYLAKIKRAAAAGTGLTSQLLDFSRKRPMERASIDMNRLVQRAESMLRCLVPATIELKLQLNGALWVESDPGQLEQVLLNLVANARDAMPRGGTLTITTAGSCPRRDNVPGTADPTLDAYSSLAVTDTGVGMDEDTQRRIFEPFFTTKPVGEGTGLGLATVYGTVSHGGGHLHLTSAPGQGTTFRVCLPQAEPPRRTQEKPLPEIMAHGDGETILVVEDEESVRATIRHRLEERGYCVLPAANGEQALRICKRPGPIALAITDIILPGAPGDEVAREIVKLRPGLPILYMSALPQDRLVREGRIDAQAVSLQKPFSERELLVAVKEHLDAAAEAAAGRETEAARTGKPRVVLLVENDRTGGRSLKDLLELADYTVIPVDRAETALELAAAGKASTPIDFVLADLSLPDKNGLVLIKELLAARPELAAILITGRELPEPFAAEAAAEPRLRVVCEPLDFEGLLDCMAGLLGPRR